MKGVKVDFTLLHCITPYSNHFTNLSHSSNIYRSVEQVAQSQNIYRLGTNILFQHLAQRQYVCRSDLYKISTRDIAPKSI